MTDPADEATSEASVAPSPQPKISRDDVIAAVVHGALQRFHIELGEYRTLLRAVGRAGSERDRPPELRRLGDQLGRDRRRRAEEAVDDLRPRFEREVELAFGRSPEPAEDSSPGSTRHPWAPEQLVALALVQIGPLGLQSLNEELIGRCGAETMTLRYAFAYLGWVSQSPASEVLAETLLARLVASFEEAIAALARLWATLHPRALGVQRRQLPGEDVLNYDARDLRRLMIDDLVDDFINGGPPRWVTRFSELHIEIVSLADDWPSVLELFARRNAVVHRGGRVDRQYLARLGAEEDDALLGTRLRTRRVLRHEGDRSPRLASDDARAACPHALRAGGRVHRRARRGISVPRPWRRALAQGAAHRRGRTCGSSRRPRALRAAGQSVDGAPRTR